MKAITTNLATHSNACIAAKVSKAYALPRRYSDMLHSGHFPCFTYQTVFWSAYPGQDLLSNRSQVVEFPGATERLKAILDRQV